MAWPPVLPPAGRTNSTLQLDAHPSDHNALVAALQAMLPTVWTAVPTTAPWNASNPTPLQYRLVGDVVQIRGAGKRTSATATLNETIGTLPAGFRPPVTFFFMAPYASAHVLGQIATTGIITAQGMGSGVSTFDALNVPANVAFSVT